MSRGLSFVKNRIILLIIIFGALCFLRDFEVHAAAKSYVSQIAIASGIDAKKTLENKGYTALPHGLNLNLSSAGKTVDMTGEANVCLGYKMNNGSGITDLVISEKNRSTIVVNKISYKRVADVSLNHGTDGKKIYLYYTKDKKAGSALLDFDTAIYEKKAIEKSADIPLKNDASIPVRMVDGDIANLESGKNGAEYYLYMIKDKMCEPYVSEVEVFAESNLAAAVKKAVKAGYHYYVEGDLNSSTADYELLAYNRTKDKNLAITSLIGLKEKKHSFVYQKNKYELAGNQKLKGKVDNQKKMAYYLYYSKQKAAGKPIRTIVYSTENKNYTIDSAECARLSFMTGQSVAVSYLTVDNEYQKLEREKDTYRFNHVVCVDGGKVCLPILSVQSTKKITEKGTDTEKSTDTEKEPKIQENKKAEAVSGSNVTVDSSSGEPQDTASIFASDANMMKPIIILFLVAICFVAYKSVRNNKGGK